jgi:hypothetical protein
MNITVRYSSIDRFRETRRFKTLDGARKYATNWVGENAELGSRYAVSFDGIGKVEVEGCTLQELFHGVSSKGAFEVHVGCVHEGRGLSFYRDSAFATLTEAVARANELGGDVDDLKLIGITEAAADAIAAHLEAQRARYEAQCFMDREIEGSPF